MGGDRKRQGDGCSLIQARAGGFYGSAVLANDISYQKKTETSALDAKHRSARNAVEAAEDTFVLVGWEADAGVGDAERRPGVVGDGERAADMHALGGIFDSVIQNVKYGRAEIFDDAHDTEVHFSRYALKQDGFGRKMVPLESDGDTVGDERLKIDQDAVLQTMTLTEFSSFENLLDRGEEAVGVGEHVGVELLALLFIDGAALEGFEIEPDAGDGSLELVGDGVEEGVLTLVPSNFADEEDGVEHDASNQQGEQDDSQDRERNGALVEHDPANIERDRKTDEEDAERDEEGDRSSAAGDVHAGSLAKYMSFALTREVRRCTAGVRHEKQPGALAVFHTSEVEETG
jgi:hypothetical protein